MMMHEELFEIMSHHRPPTAAKEWPSRANFFIDRMVAYPDSPLATAVCNVYLALLDEEIRTGVRFLSIKAAVGATNLSRNTVRSALQELRVAGYLMEGGQNPTPPSGRQPKSGPTTSDL